MVKKLHEDYLPDMINRFERRAAANNAPEGWIWGEKVSVVTACVCVLRYDVMDIDVCGDG